MPQVQALFYYIPAFLVLIVLMRIEVMLARDVASQRIDVFGREKCLEYKLCGAIYLAHWLIDGSAIAIPVMVINALGGGFIHLASGGAWYVPSFILYLFLFDLYVYLVHRAYHKIPLLWSMHSLHHSASAMSTTTGGRHFWFEYVVSAIFFAPFLGILVRVPDDIILPVTFLNFFVGAISHFDVPIALGKLSFLFTGPQWHRIHHSRLPQHRDRNFANFFPIFDVLFGTAWIPSRDEFPLSGLDTGDKPNSVFEGMIWPLRQYWRRMHSAEAKSPAVNSST